MGVVLLSFMLNLAEEDYYNPTPLSTGLDREDTEGSNPNFVSPNTGLVNSYSLANGFMSIIIMIQV